LDEIYIVNPFLRPSADNLLKSKFIIGKLKINVKLFLEIP